MGEVISMADFRNKVAAPPVESMIADEPAQALSVSNGVVKKADGVEVFDYPSMMKRSFFHLIHEVLSEVVENGLPKNSVLMIQFDTKHLGVQISDRLSKMHPKNMTIVLDAWWENLVVTKDGFDVVLNFGDVRERLIVPFEAIKTFTDEPVGFGLRFGAADQNDQTPPPEPPLVA